MVLLADARTAQPYGAAIFQELRSINKRILCDLEQVAQVIEQVLGGAPVATDRTRHLPLAARLIVDRWRSLPAVLWP